VNNVCEQTFRSLRACHVCELSVFRLGGCKLGAQLLGLPLCIAASCRLCKCIPASGCCEPSLFLHTSPCTIADTTLKAAGRENIPPTMQPSYPCACRWAAVPSWRLPRRAWLHVMRSWQTWWQRPWQCSAQRASTHASWLSTRSSARSAAVWMSAILFWLGKGAGVDACARVCVLRVCVCVCVW